MTEKNEGFSLPEDLSSVSDAELSKLLGQAEKMAESLSKDKNLDGAGLEKLTNLADQIDTVRGETGKRTEAAAKFEADKKAVLDRLAAGKAETESAAEAAESTDTAAETTQTETAPVETPDAQTSDAESQNAQVPAMAASLTPEALATAVTAAVDTLMEKKYGGVIATERQQFGRKLNLNLAEIEARKVKLEGDRSEAVLVASADIPGIPQGGRLSGINDLVKAMTARARTLPITNSGSVLGAPIASMDRKFNLVVDRDTPLSDVKTILDRATDEDALVAAGGWCAPSEISYDFYNIVCEDGLLDLPSIGINRGGLRWPTSASFGDVVDDPWTWTETMDIAAVTGTAQSGVKPCVRVPCPGFNEERLACDGICLTVGNLTNDAFPELIANHTRLLFAAQAHYMNARLIGSVLNLSNAPLTIGVSGTGVVAPVLGALELQAVDLREKYRMCDNSVVEAILPRWLRAVMRSDIRKRMGLGTSAAEMAVADSTIMSWLDAIGVRAQWVTDWQVSASGFPGQSTAATSWPTTVQAVVYPVGTFVRGSGMRLDLGVVRDSMLNQTNDFTAAWMEECWLTARFGHESRRINIPICPSGQTGANNLTGCTV